MPTPQYEDVYEPPLLDATFIDKIDDLIAELQNLSAPSATNVSVDATGMDVITATNAQGALKQLDSAVDSLDSNLANLVKTKYFDIKCTNLTNGAYLDSYINLDTGYKLLSWLTPQSVGWVLNTSIYVTDVNRVWWSGTLDQGANSYIRFIYLEIRNI